MAQKKRKKEGTANKKTKLNTVRPPPSTFPPDLLQRTTPCNTSKCKYRSNTNVDVDVLYPGGVFSAQNFFSAEECKAWIGFCEASGMERVAHPATRWIAHRECGRLQLNDSSMADRLYERMMQQTTILPIIAAQIDMNVTMYGSSSSRNSNKNNYRPVGCNSNLRLYRYEKGMSFGKHVDGSNHMNQFGSSGNTEITVLIYLSSCDGGATRFYPPNKSTSFKKSFAFEPQQGAILFHIHGDRCLEHEADPVLHGVKYVLRTDIVYATTTT